MHFDFVHNLRHCTKSHENVQVKNLILNRTICRGIRCKRNIKLHVHAVLDSKIWKIFATKSDFNLISDSKRVRIFEWIILHPKFQNFKNLQNYKILFLFDNIHIEIIIAN